MIRILNRRFMHPLAALVVIAAAAAAGVAATAIGPHFYGDDPLPREPATQDASAAEPSDINLLVDLTLNLFATPGDKTPNVRAGNVNTADEVPDSNWFTNRILATPISAERAATGVATNPPPAPGRWVVTAPKNSGVSPGFTMRDPSGVLWFVSLDAKGFPEAATAAVMVANRIFWTLGYWQVENHLISVRPDQLAIAENSSITPPSGRKRPMRQGDLDDVFARAERASDGTYRAVAARALPGKVLGGFRYYGTRSDDPNDLVPHEHRRELRALKVFGAWTNLVDMKAGNTLDTLVTENGRSVVRHYLQDVGSTFGTGALGPRDYDEGYEHVLDLGLMKKRFFRLGFPTAAWQTTEYQDNQAVGRFGSEAFDPVEWKPRVPVSALLRARADDNFWAARRVAAFSDEMIRAVVKTGQYSHPADEALLGDVLIERRKKIAAAYLNAVNPLVDFSLSAAGRLTFRNAAIDAGVGTRPASGYRAAFASFDNATGETSAIGSPVTAMEAAIEGPPRLPANAGSFLKVSVAAVSASQPAWNETVDVYFRRTASEWQVVGINRLPKIDPVPGTR